MPEKQSDSPDRIVPSTELAEELASLPTQKTFSTGFKSLDALTRGVREGDLIILSGLTGHGKTQLMVSWAKNALEQAPLIFSYEIPSQELFERFGADLPVFYLPRINTSSAPAWIEKKIQEAIKKFGTKIVFVDHLHYLVDAFTIRNRNSSEIIGAMCREFKKIAMKNRIVLVLICHVRKISSKTGRPTIDDLKDSSGIAQEADIVMLLHRIGARRRTKVEEDDLVAISNEAWLYLDKVRRHGGMLGKIKMELDENGFYQEVEQ